MAVTAVVAVSENAPLMIQWKVVEQEKVAGFEPVYHQQRCSVSRKKVYDCDEEQAMTSVKNLPLKSL